MPRYEFYEKNDGTTSDATIAHFGVKGMKWGVRKDRATSGVRKLAKKDPVLNAIGKGAKRGAQFGKYYVTPQTDTVRGAISDAKSGGRGLLAKAQRRIANSYIKDADSFADGIRQIQGEMKSKQGLNGKTHLKRLQKGIDEVDEQILIETNPKRLSKLEKQRARLEAGKKHAQTKDSRDEKAAKELITIFKETEREFRATAKDLNARAAQNEAKSQAHRDSATASYKKQIKRNYGFGSTAVKKKANR